MLRSRVVADAIGCTQAEVYVGLHHPKFTRTLTIDVPKWTGQNLRQAAEEADWERTIVWKDGTFERTEIGPQVFQRVEG